MLLCAASGLLHRMQDSETWLARWQRAGLIDDATAAAIRAYEESHDEAQQPPMAGAGCPDLWRHPPRRWSASVCRCTLGSFVADGPHVAGAGDAGFLPRTWDAFPKPFRRLRHRPCTGLAPISAGAAIALVGQIFNMQEHWPSAVMLWALCAAFGWALLRDQFQQTLTLLLVPAWMMSEWMDRGE